IRRRPEFQRLRSIKQLGTTYYVWPGASHNRFEHCLGVGYLAREMALHLQRDQPELGITDRDVKCVHIAGLCHDLGHGPWSHVWDGVFIPKALPNSTWTHEEGSEMMFDHLLDTSETPIAIDADERTFIKALIRGDPSRCTRKEKAFLFDIVANKRNGIDVDKFDYILRDTKEVGVSKNVHLQRIIKSARVIDDEICYDIKDADALFEVCQTRYSLHKSFYNHKTAKAIEYMVIDALLLADPYMNISRRIYDPVLYRFLTDNILDRIEESALDPKLCDALAPAREIVHRVRTRKLYKMVDYGPVPWKEVQRYKEHVTPARIATIAKRGLSQDDLQASDNIIVDFSPLHYGMKDKNPLDYIKFYSKNNPNKAESADPDSFSTILPAVFGEYMLRIYTKDPKYFGIVQAAYRKLL
ncbi:HD-domain/PDEase-like protein, partial [Fistulina hepatica ATCC 64428]